ncbi:MAG: integration host factor subunit beta [bacterium]|nr:integration host factor subunit beta [bacterium]
MNKQDLIDVIAQETMTDQEAKEIVNTVFNIMKNALKSGDKVVISGFGTFDMHKRKSRIGRNPNTGEKVLIDEQDILKFKTSKTFYR